MSENAPPIFDVPIFNPAYFLEETSPFFINPNTGDFVVPTTLKLTQDTIAIGKFAGATQQGTESVAIGLNAGNDTQGQRSIAIGLRAGENEQGNDSVAIGRDTTNRGDESIAIGTTASTGSFTNSVAIGTGATAGANNEIRIGTPTSVYQMDGRLNLFRDRTTSLISYNNAVKMYRFEDGLTIGSFSNFAINVNDTTATPSSVPASRSGRNIFFAFPDGRTFVGSSINNQETRIRSSFNGLILDGYGSTNATLLINTNRQVIKSSDIRLKENITYYDQPSIEKIMKLKPAYYTWKDDKSKHINLGFIAQDVEDIIPEAVDGKKYEYEWERDEDGEPILDASGNLQFTDEPRYRGFSDRPLICVLVKAVQELKLEIEALKKISY